MADLGYRERRILLEHGEDLAVDGVHGPENPCCRNAVAEFTTTDRRLFLPRPSSSVILE
jgi:hypothetical protein